MEEHAVEALEWQTKLDLTKPCTQVLRDVVEMFRTSTTDDKAQVLAMVLTDLCSDPDGIMHPDHDHACVALAKTGAKPDMTFDKVMKRAVKHAIKSPGETVSVFTLVLKQMTRAKDSVARQTRRVIERLEPDALEDMVSELLYKYGKGFLARCFA